MTLLCRSVFLLMLFALAPVAASSAGLETRIVEPRGVSLAMRVDGLVEARRQAIVAAQVQGRLLEVRADAGQRVAQGQLLALIDARESTEATAAAQANASAAKATLERSKALVAQKYMSASVLDKAQADYDAAEAQTQALQVNKGHSRIVAPMAGLIAARHAEAGELASPGRALFTIYEPAGMRMVAHVPQSRLAEIRASRKALVEFAELGRTVESAAITLLPTIDGETHTATVRIDLPAGASFAVPGMAGRVRFLSGESVRVTLPKSAVVHRGEVAGVYVKDAQGRFRLRQLRLGEVFADGEVEVLAGLATGEAVALDPIKAALSVRR